MIFVPQIKGGGKKKTTKWPSIVEFTSERDERMEMLVNSCISEVDRVGMREHRKSCAARPRKEGRHAVSKFRRAVTMKTTVEDRQRSNIATVFERLKTVNQRRRVDDAKDF